MSLIDAFYTPCVMLERRRRPDGLGGYTTTWADGAEFMAAIVKNDTLEAQLAEKQGVTEVYTVTTPEGVGLEYHDVFRRKGDGATFRATGNARDSMPPRAASFRFEQAKAERWEIT